jgi:hypothetical protein
MFGRGDRLPYQSLLVLIWSVLKKEETDKLDTPRRRSYFGVRILFVQIGSTLIGFGRSRAFWAGAEFI